jgi:hypothetical protein
MIIPLILMVFAFVLFVIGAYYGEKLGRFSLVAAGLAFLTAAHLASGLTKYL